MTLTKEELQYMDDAEAEITRLRQRVAELERRDQRSNELFGELFDMSVDQAGSQKENAERYQKLRKGYKRVVVYLNDPDSAANGMWLTGEYLDAVIDAGEPL